MKINVHCSFVEHRDVPATVVNKCPVSTGTDTTRLRQFGGGGKTADVEETRCQDERHEYKGQIRAAAETISTHHTAAFTVSASFKSPACYIVNVFVRVIVVSFALVFHQVGLCRLKWVVLYLSIICADEPCLSVWKSCFSRHTRVMIIRRDVSTTFFVGRFYSWKLCNVMVWFKITGMTLFNRPHMISCKSSIKCVSVCNRFQLITTYLWNKKGWCDTNRAYFVEGILLYATWHSPCSVCLSNFQCMSVLVSPRRSTVWLRSLNC